MKIANKITKRQFTALNKQNVKMITEEIECAYLDFKAVANNLGLNKTCIEWLDDQLTDGNYKETTKHYKKELDEGYEIFIRNRNKIYKAYQKGLK